MSITFKIDGIEFDDQSQNPCPDCGAVPFAPDIDEPRCATCGGYGGCDPIPNPYELNVANGNAAAVFAMCGLLDEQCGTADPESVLTALAVAHSRLEAHVRGEVREKNWFDGGLSVERIERYHATMTKIAQKALQYGRLISWC